MLRRSPPVAESRLSLITRCSCTRDRGGGGGDGGASVEAPFAESGHGERVGPRLLFYFRDVAREREKETPADLVLPGSLQLSDADAVFGLDILMTWRILGDNASWIIAAKVNKCAVEVCS